MPPPWSRRRGRRPRGGRARCSARARRRRTAPSRCRCRTSARARRRATSRPAPKRTSASPAASASLTTWTSAPTALVNSASASTSDPATCRRWPRCGSTPWRTTPGNVTPIGPVHVEVADELGDDGGHRLRRRRLRRQDLEPLGGQLAGGQVDRRRLHPRPADVDAERLLGPSRQRHRYPVAPNSSVSAASKTSVWRSASAGTWCGVNSAMLWNGVSSTPRLSAYRWRNASSSASPAARRGGAVARRRAEPVLGPAAEPLHVPRQPVAGDHRGDAVGEPLGQRDGDGEVLVAQASSARAARIAATRHGVAGERAADPADVDRRVLEVGPHDGRQRRADRPYAAAGTPPPIGLPITSRSGSSPWAAVYPPGPAQIVCVSSMTQQRAGRRG